MLGLEGETDLDQAFLITSSTALVVGGWWLVVGGWWLVAVVVVVVVSDGDGGGVDWLVQHWFCCWLKMCLPGSACLRILDTHSSVCCSWSSKYHCIYWYPKCSVDDTFTYAAYGSGYPKLCSSALAAPSGHLRGERSRRREKRLAPEHKPPGQRRFPIGNHHFERRFVSFRECKWICFWLGPPEILWIDTQNNETDLKGDTF